MTTSTPVLTIPPTQNTALVLDFRCLYTHDLRRKQKRWQDGLARFHTFNKRLMVYDEARNFIGDTHWRELGPVQDGDELQLDKGVMIQIGEQTARTEQDLQGLLEKRKRAPNAVVESSAPIAMLSPTPCTALQTPITGNSALRPKSLNTLLGTPRGRLGRAALPQKSPHELRLGAQVRQSIDERPTKRPRITSHEDERHAQIMRQIRISTSNSVPRTAKHQQIERPANEEESPCVSRRTPERPEIPIPHQGQERTVQIDHADAQQSRNAERSFQRDLRGAAPRTDKHRSAANEGAQGPHVSDSNTPNIHPPQGEPPVLPRLTKKPPDTHCSPPTSRLRIASTKPRKKLMYRDLLPKANPPPDDDLPTPSVSHDTGNESKDEGFRGQEGPSQSLSTDSRKPLSASQFHRDQSERVRARLRKHERRKPIDLDEEERAAFNGTRMVESCNESAAEGRTQRAEAAPMSSALNMPQAVVHLIEDNDDENLFCTQDEGMEFSSMEAPPDLPIPPIDQIPTPPKNISPPYVSERRDASPPPPLTTLPSDPSPPPSPPRPPIPHGQTPTKPNSNPRTKTPLSRSHTLPACPSSVIQRAQRNTAFRKTLSDTSAADPARNDALVSKAPQAVPLEPQPWSVREAWELFGERREDVVRRVKERESETGR